MNQLPIQFSYVRWGQTGRFAFPLSIGVGLIVALAMLFAFPARAETVTADFEDPPFTLGDIHNQDGWTKTGGYDYAVSSSLGTPGFGAQSLRISDAITSGSFGDMTFAKPLTNAVAEIDSTAGAYPTGVLQRHFEMQFDIASAEPGALQPGLLMSVSPDRGDGSRLSYLRFEDQADGVHVFFDDVTNPGPLGTVSSFNETEIATLTRTPHTIKLTLDLLDGPANDVAKVYIDGVLVHTGTSWEDYYRYDPESIAEQSPRIVRTVIFRTSGGADPGNDGKGFLFDNFSTYSGTSAYVTIKKYIDGSPATAESAMNLGFPMTASWSAANLGSGSGSYELDADGFNGDPTPYQAITSPMSVPADYGTEEITTDNDVVGTSCSDGKPFALEGYSVGSTLEEAESAPKTPTAPSFTGLLDDRVVIVWNVSCKAEVSGSKFFDINNNGSWDSGEPALPGWTIDLLGPTSGSAVTSQLGTFAFSGLPAGDYSLSETLLPGWTQTTSPAPFSLTPGETKTGLDFGNSCLVSTGGKSIGFWGNKNGQALVDSGDLAALVAMNLRNANGSSFDPASYGGLKSWLSKAESTNMAHMLSAQLTAVKLSVLNSLVNESATILAPQLVPFAPLAGLSELGTIRVQDLMALADTELGTHALTKADSPDRSYQEALKNTLDLVANNSVIAVCPVTLTYSAADSSYYNGLAESDPLYGSGELSFTWDPVTGNVLGGYYNEVVPPSVGTTYYNVVTGGTVSGSNVTLTFSRTLPSPYGPFEFIGTLVGGVLSGQLDGPYLLTANGTVTP